MVVLKLIRNWKWNIYRRTVLYFFIFVQMNLHDIAMYLHLYMYKYMLPIHVGVYMIFGVCWGFLGPSVFVIDSRSPQITGHMTVVAVWFVCWRILRHK